MESLVLINKQINNQTKSVNTIADQVQLIDYFLIN